MPAGGLYKRHAWYQFSSCCVYEPSSTRAQAACKSKATHCKTIKEGFFPVHKRWNMRTADRIDTRQSRYRTHPAHRVKRESVHLQTCNRLRTLLQTLLDPPHLGLEEGVSAGRTRRQRSNPRPHAAAWLASHPQPARPEAWTLRSLRHASASAEFGAFRCWLMAPCSVVYMSGNRR